jgi:DNA-binding MarR family transcriptional regulator
MITRQLDADLRGLSGLSLSEFEILLHLAWAGGERRMAQIAQDLVLTGGGVTRIVARLEKLGLLKRRACPQDGRGIFAVLNDKGWAKQRSVHEIHLDGVRRLFLQAASGPELKILGRLFGKMADQARSAGRSSGAACALDGSKMTEAKQTPSPRSNGSPRRPSRGSMRPARGHTA